MTHVVYRCCDAVQVCSARARFCGLPKHDLVKGCLRSFLPLPPGVLFHVVADNCSDELVEFVRSSVSPETLVRTSVGNAESFCRCVEIAAALRPPDWVFMLEDDYLSLVPEMLRRLGPALQELSEVNGRRCAIMPDDYFDRYDGRRRNTEVCVVRQGNFMRIDKTTCTFAASAGDIARHADDLLRFRDWPRVKENGSVNRMWQDVPLYSPLPAWTCHVQIRSALPPYLCPESVAKSVTRLARIT